MIDSEFKNTKGVASVEWSKFIEEINAEMMVFNQSVYINVNSLFDNYLVQEVSRVSRKHLVIVSAGNDSFLGHKDFITAEFNYLVIDRRNSRSEKLVAYGKLVTNPTKSESSRGYRISHVAPCLILISCTKTGLRSVVVRNGLTIFSILAYLDLFVKKIKVASYPSMSSIMIVDVTKSMIRRNISSCTADRELKLLSLYRLDHSCDLGIILLDGVVLWPYKDNGRRLEFPWDSLSITARKSVSVTLSLREIIEQQLKILQDTIKVLEEMLAASEKFGQGNLDIVNGKSEKTQLNEWLEGVVPGRMIHSFVSMSGHFSIFRETGNWILRCILCVHCFVFDRGKSYSASNEQMLAIISYRALISAKSSSGAFDLFYSASEECGCIAFKYLVFDRGKAIVQVNLFMLYSQRLASLQVLKIDVIAGYNYISIV